MKLKVRLTEAVVARLTIPDGKIDETWFDSEIKGFGVRKRGKDATYFLQYQLNGTPRKLTLGRRSEIRCEVARDLAKAKRGEIAKAKLGLGIDPAIARENAKAESNKPKPQSLGAIIADYLATKKAAMRPRTYSGAAYQLETLFKPLHNAPLNAVTRAAIAAQLGTIARECGNVTANRSRSTLSSLFAWAMSEGIAESNPVIGSTVRPEKPRERVLSDGELATLFLALPDDRFGRIVRLLVLTGCRRDEIGSLRWSEVDLVARTITLPASRTKNKRAHTTPLSESALKVLQSVPQDGDYVFGGFGHWSYNKMKLDGVVKFTVPWTLHDLRRTCATGMADLGVQPHIIEAVLNHVSGHKAGVAGIYNRATYETEKTAALELWAGHLAVAVAQASGTNVTRLRQTTQ
jgi:integrase